MVTIRAFPHNYFYFYQKNPPCRLASKIYHTKMCHMVENFDFAN